jgi:DNA-binding SARP family transcriptional activator
VIWTRRGAWSNARSSWPPYDDDRYLRVATILDQQGRKGAALSVLRRARAALAQLGIDPPPDLGALEASIAAPGTSRERSGTVTLV